MRTVDEAAHNFKVYRLVRLLHALKVIKDDELIQHEEVIWNHKTVGIQINWENIRFTGYMKLTNSKPISIIARNDPQYGLFLLLFKFKILTQLIDQRPLRWTYNGVGMNRSDVGDLKWTADSEL